MNERYEWERPQVEITPIEETLTGGMAAADGMGKS